MTSFFFPSKAKYGFQDRNLQQDLWGDLLNCEDQRIGFESGGLDRFKLADLHTLMTVVWAMRRTVAIISLTAAQTVPLLQSAPVIPTNNGVAQGFHDGISMMV